MDQIRYDTPGCNGNSVCQTPAIDRLARSGVTFDRAYSPSSLCTPSRTSMLTGEFAFHHGLITNCDLYHAPVTELPHPENLLHHRLLDQGYRCGFVGKSHLGTEKAPEDYGFEGFSPPGYGNIREEKDFRKYLSRLGLDYAVRDPIYANPNETTCLAGIWEGPAESTPAGFLAHRTIQQLERYAEQDEPFFLTCQFWGPHQAHLPSREFAGMHDREKIRSWANYEDAWDGKPEMVKQVHRDFYRAVPENWDEWREVVGRYYDFTAMIDAQMGRILDRLQTLGLADNTIVVFTTDHGDMTGSHGGMIDKGYPYEEAHRIPLIVSWPGRFAEGQRSSAMVYNMDVFPTLLDALGLPVPDRDGQSFLPILEGDEGAGGRREIYLEFHGLRFLYSQRALVTDDGWKYVFTPGDRDEVYDLNADPAELHNLIDESDAVEHIERLQNRMMELAHAVDDPLAPCVCKYFGRWDRAGGQFDALRI